MNKQIGVVGLPGSWSTERLADAVNEKTGSRMVFNMEQIYFDSMTNTVRCNGTDLSQLDAIIIKKIGQVYSPDLLDRLEILRFLNKRGLPIFSKPINIIGLIDRLSCTITMQLGNIPIPPTVITEDISQAVDVVQEFGEAVFKPLYTSKARGMMVINANNGAKEKVTEFKSCGNPMMYIQKKLTLPGRDFGITFLGGDYLATYARVGDKKSWNTTTHSGGKYQPYEPSKELIDLAYKAQSLFNLDFTCVDVAETPDGPIVFEVSAFGGFRGLLEANNLDIASRYVDYVLEKLNVN